MFIPARAGALAEAPRRVFDAFPTVPITLAAVASTVKAAGPPPTTALGLAEQPPHHGKHGKKGAAAKNAARALEAGPALQRGFALKELSWKGAKGTADSAASPGGGIVPVSLAARFFSAPLGSSLTSDPAVLEGGSVGQLASSDPTVCASWARQRPAKERLVLFGGAAAQEREEAGGNAADWAEALSEAQRTHSQRSEALLEAFTAQIEASFAAPKTAAGKAGQQAKQPVPAVGPGLGQYPEMLVKAFAGLCTRAQAENPTLRTLADLHLVSKVLKLLQQLLKQELALADLKKVEVLRVSAMSPLIHFVMQTLSMSILREPSTIPLVGYQLLPGLVNVIALLKEAFKVHDQGKEPSTAGALPKSGVNLLDCLQALTSEGIDFTRERVFETPHPYPQNDYSQSETIEVPKAIGFIVELDKRCSAEHATD